MQLPTTSDSSKHMHKSTALKRQTGIRSFFLHYYFTFLPLSALTCLSCDGTQAFFRNRWYSDGLGEPDHLISYLLLLLLKSPPASTFHLCSTRCLRLYRLTISFIWPVTIYGGDLLFKWWKDLSCQRCTEYHLQNKNYWEGATTLKVSVPYKH